MNESDENKENAHYIKELDKRMEKIENNIDYAKFEIQEQRISELEKDFKMLETDYIAKAEEIAELREQLRLEVDMRITNTKTLNRFLNDWANRVKNNREVLRELYKKSGTIGFTEAFREKQLAKLEAPKTEKKDPTRNIIFKREVRERAMSLKEINEELGEIQRKVKKDSETEKKEVINDLTDNSWREIFGEKEELTLDKSSYGKGYVDGMKASGGLKECDHDWEFRDPENLGHDMLFCKKCGYLRDSKPPGLITFMSKKEFEGEKTPEPRNAKCLECGDYFIEECCHQCFDNSQFIQKKEERVRDATRIVKREDLQFLIEQAGLSYEYSDNKVGVQYDRIKEEYKIE